jgi:hypothetical protein
MAILMEHGKQFLVVGNVNAVTCREIFPLIRDNKVWLWNKAGHFWFKVPPHYEEKSTDFKIDETGQKWRRMGNICWFTNLDIEKRHEEMTLFRYGLSGVVRASHTSDSLRGSLRSGDAQAPTALHISTRPKPGNAVE